MNIFTNNDYRKIQAWLKANAIKDSDLVKSETTIPDKDIITIVQKVNGIPTNFKINIKDFLNSSLNKIIIQLFTANAIKESAIAFVSFALVSVVSIFPCHNRSVT